MNLSGVTVSAPAAGTHFSRESLKRMEIKGIDSAFITSHMSLGNFREIDVEDLTKHKMDSEQMSVTAETADTVNKARDEERNIWRPYRDWETDRKSTRLNSSHRSLSRMPSSA